MEAALAKKLQIKEGRSVAVLSPPKGAPLEAVKAPKGGADVAITFVAKAADVEARLERAIAAAKPDTGIVWIAYPKKTGSVATDLGRDAGWEPLAARDWVPVTLISIDADWSAFRVRHAPDLAAARAARIANGTRSGAAPSHVPGARSTPRVVRPAPAAPPDLAAALAGDAKAGAAWARLAPSHKREHVDALEKAKKPETRARRLEATLAKLRA
ncbi:MAG TPA: YdeI/OmpD-associated family protein [Byssovorax sp.]|jgi:hypothetical protein